MKNSDLSFTALVYNAHINVIPHKAGIAKYKNSINSLIDKCYTDACIIKALSPSSALENGYTVREYTVKQPKSCTRLKDLMNVPTRVYYSAEAREQELILAESARDIVNSKDAINGRMPKLLTPAEYEAACNTLATGQFSVELETVAISKEMYTCAPYVTLIQKVDGNKVRAYSLDVVKETDSITVYDEVICKAMYFKTEIDVTKMLPERMGTPIDAVFNFITGRDAECSVSGINPYCKEKSKDGADEA